MVRSGPARSEKALKPKMANITWRDVLDCKLPGTYLGVTNEEAKRLGYDYFCHNGWIYSSKGEKVLLASQLEHEEETKMKMAERVAKWLSTPGKSSVIPADLMAHIMANKADYGVPGFNSGRQVQKEEWKEPFHNLGTKVVLIGADGTRTILGRIQSLALRTSVNDVLYFVDIVQSQAPGTIEDEIAAPGWPSETVSRQFHLLDIYRDKDGPTTHNLVFEVREIPTPHWGAI